MLQRGGRQLFAAHNPLRKAKLPPLHPHDPDQVATLVSIADAQQRDLVSYMVLLRAVTLAEKCLIPAFVFFFLKLYPPAWIAAAHRRSCGSIHCKLRQAV